MFCTTECWNCEDKNCKNYISKQELYFENQQLKEDNKTLRENYENGIKLLKQNKQLKSLLDEIREILTEYQRYAPSFLNQFRIDLSKCFEILDKVKDL